MSRKPDTPAADPDQPDRQDRVNDILDRMVEGLGTFRAILEEEVANQPPRRLS